MTMRAPSARVYQNRLCSVTAFLILLALTVWASLGLGMMAGVSAAYRVTDMLEAWSGLGAWFSPLYLFVLPLVLVVAFGMLGRRFR